MYTFFVFHTSPLCANSLNQNLSEKGRQPVAPSPTRRVRGEVMRQSSEKSDSSTLGNRTNAVAGKPTAAQDGSAQLSCAHSIQGFEACDCEDDDDGDE